MKYRYKERRDIQKTFNFSLNTNFKARLNVDARYYLLFIRVNSALSMAGNVGSPSTITGFSAPRITVGYPVLYRVTAISLLRLIFEETLLLRALSF